MCAITSQAGAMPCQRGRRLQLTLRHKKEIETMVCRLILGSIALLTFVLSQGCATLSKEECLSADWRIIGYEDGSRGFSSQRISQHREACNDHGITPDFDAYLDGHGQGIRKYCVPAKGFALGRSGKRYGGICPGDLEGAFLAAYDEGKAVYQLGKEIGELQKEVRQARNEQDSLYEELQDNEAMIISDTTSPNLRGQLLLQNRKLEQLIDEKQGFIEQSEDEIGWLRERMEKIDSDFRKY